jgi:arsenate reductase
LGNTARLTFIGTHNSRRSHFGQVWAAVAAHYFGMQNIETYSGGTEVTAFNPRAVAALERVGFEVETTKEENPHYRLYFAEDVESLLCFSKKYDDPANPQKDFIAIMTCSEADENCPFIPGAKHRFSLTYRDPKEADDAPQETNRYDERCRQIATEMCYLMRQL